MTTFDEMNAMQGKYFPAIEIAVEQMESRGLHIKDYQIEIFQEGDIISVLFSDPNSPRTAKGSVGRPGYQVRLDKNRRVIKSNFVR